MTAKEVEKLLKQNGWEPIRQVGSHKMFRKANNNDTKTIVVPFHSSKDIPIGTLNSILKQAGLK